MDQQTSPSNKVPTTTVAASLLTRQEVALALSTCLRTVDEAIATGEIEVVVIGRSVRIRPSSLESFIEARTTRRNPRTTATRKAASKKATNTGGSL